MSHVISGFITRKKIMGINKIINIVGIIFLGALGSGLWNLAGEPTAGFIYNTITSFGGSVAIVYGNQLNSSIGSGGWGDRSSILWFIIFTCLLTYYMFTGIKSKLNNSYIVLIVLLSSILFIGWVSHKVIYSHKATLYFDKNIEILAPNISREEHLQLRASYRSINNLETFNKAQKQVLDFAKRHNIEIDSFN